MLIVVASKNPVKLNAVRIAFEKVFVDEIIEIEGVSVKSEVPDQPTSEKETLTGAKNRAENARKEVLDADYWVGIEGGIEQTDRGMKAFAYMVTMNKKGRIGYGETSEFLLPIKVAELIREGKELGEADDIVFNRKNSKQENGAIGILTNDLITRETFYTEAVIMSLIPFINPELY